jgi:hypothetical protein
MGILELSEIMLSGSKLENCRFCSWMNQSKLLVLLVELVRIELTTS